MLLKIGKYFPVKSSRKQSFMKYNLFIYWPLQYGFSLLIFNFKFLGFDVFCKSKVFFISRICCRLVKFLDSSWYEIKRNVDQPWVLGIWITILFLFPRLPYLPSLILVFRSLFAALALFQLINRSSYRFTVLTKRDASLYNFRTNTALYVIGI